MTSNNDNEMTVFGNRKQLILELMETIDTLRAENNALKEREEMHAMMIMGVNGAYEEAKKENKVVKEVMRDLTKRMEEQEQEIAGREEERYCMWKTYCVYQNPDCWDDEEDYQNNKNTSYISSYHHANEDEDE